MYSCEQFVPISKMIVGRNIYPEHLFLDNCYTVIWYIQIEFSSLVLLFILAYKQNEIMYFVVDIHLLCP